MKRKFRLVKSHVAIVIAVMTYIGVSSISYAEKANDGKKLAANVESVLKKETILERHNKGMYVVMTGATGPWDVQGGGGSSVAVIVDGELIQFDMGAKTLEHLQKSGISPSQISYLFFTHLHIDHISDFTEYSYVYAPFTKVKYYGPVHTKAMVTASQEIQAVHRKDHDAIGIPKYKEIPIEEISAGVVLETEKFTITATPTIHHASADLKSYAYRVDSKYGSVVISGDTVPTPNVVDLSMNADILIHESAFLDGSILSYQDILKTIANKKFIKLEDGLRLAPDDMASFHQHTSSRELGKVAEKSKVKKLVVYHYMTHFGPPFDDTQEAVVVSEYISSIKENYTGFVVMAEPLMVFEVGMEK